MNYSPTALAYTGFSGLLALRVGLWLMVVGGLLLALLAMLPRRDRS